MLNWFKKKIPDKNPAPLHQSQLAFGSYDRKGRFSEGYIENGEMKYRQTSHYMEVWSEPVYVSVLNLTWNVYYSGLFTKPYTIKERQTVSLYRQTHKFSGINRYFYDKGKERKFIDTNAYEKNNCVVFLDERESEWV
jgi:hypothetical protein